MERALTLLETERVALSRGAEAWPRLSVRRLPEMKRLQDRVWVRREKCVPVCRSVSIFSESVRENRRARTAQAQRERDGQCGFKCQEKSTRIGERSAI
ncbi:hypothetical protein AXF42_Ash013548 [Apostasia shenzhenica]|uniref:Uncharacterized protein n=1 Tax=Apostasia shenzhenica TaxID=1088818 RepID=A0A2I0AP76_9ASPA|nr:hypothetical protein AXF42_Ash013548 [Apostasia shenzhenica]